MYLKKIFFIIIILFYANVLFATVSVITNKSNKTTSLSLAEVKHIYLGETKKWPDGQDIKLVDIKGDNASRELFYHEALGHKTIAEMESFYVKKSLAGEITAPMMLEEEKVKEFILQNKNAIGYIDSSLVDNQVKTILTIDYNWLDEE